MHPPPASPSFPLHLSPTLGGEGGTRRARSTEECGVRPAGRLLDGAKAKGKGLGLAPRRPPRTDWGTGKGPGSGLSGLGFLCTQEGMRWTEMPAGEACWRQFTSICRVIKSLMSCADQSPRFCPRRHPPGADAWGRGSLGPTRWRERPGESGFNPRAAVPGLEPKTKDSVRGDLSPMSGSVGDAHTHCYQPPPTRPRKDHPTSISRQQEAGGRTAQCKAGPGLVYPTASWLQ